MNKRSGLKLNSAKNFFGSYFFLYTVFFIFVCTGVFIYFAQTRTSLVWDPDGTAQHFTVFAYYGEYLRELISNFLSGNFAIKQFDFSIGLGSDVLTSMHYYAIGDPLNLLSVFVPVKYSAYGFSALILLRYYLSGLSFCALAKYKNVSKLGALSGAALYMFTAYTMYMAVRHPSFLSPMIYFPLLILGVEMIFDRKRPYLFVLSVFLMAASSFYFFYVVTLFIMLYIFVRLFFVYKKNFIKGFFTSLLRFASLYILGVLMAAVIFLPIVSVFLSSGRAGVEYPLSALFDTEYYKQFLTAFTDFKPIANNTLMGFTSLGIAGVIMLFLSRKKHYFLKVSFIILTVMMMIPAVGKIANGFSYVVNRWTWAYALCVAFIFAVSVSEIKNFSLKKSIVLCVAAAGYTALRCAPEGRVSSAGLVACALFVGFAVLCFARALAVYIIEHFDKIKNALKFITPKRVNRLFRLVSACAVCVAVCANAFFIYSQGQTAFTNKFLTFKSANAFAADNSFLGLAEIQNTQTAIERYELHSKSISYDDRNAAMLNKTFSNTAYLSMIDGNLSQFQKEMGKIHSNYSMLDSSSADPFINTVENARWLALPSGYAENTFSASEKPVGNVSNTSGSKLDVYENEYYVNFGAAYDKAISQEQYDSLSSVEKRQAMVQAVCINDENVSNTDISALDLEQSISDCVVNGTDGVAVSDGKIVVSEDKTKLTADVKTQKNCQIYLVFTNLQYESVSKEVLMKETDPKGYEALSDGEKAELAQNTLNFEPKTISSIKISCESGAENISTMTPNHDYYSGITDYTVNLGCSDKDINSIELEFNSGIYTCDKMQVVSVPMGDFEKQTNALNAEHLEGLKLETNKISGTISCSSDKWLYLSIPYSSNWSAYVDGEEVEIERANTAFCAVQISQGEHTVELKYSNKIIKLCSAVSAVGVLSFGALVYIFEKRKKNAKDIYRLP